MNLTFASSLSQLQELNSSFDKGVLRIAYHGTNRNGSSISKNAFERSMDSIWNCPVVCNYNRETDTIGSHDMELVNKDGHIRLVNVTDPVGVVPESAAVFWETVEENDGTQHEYLCTEVLLWKRQEAYNKIVSDGVVAQSMEITAKEGKLIDNVFHIDRFEFTAFCLLGSAQPCFESASLEMFSRSEFARQFSEMMQEAKRTIIESQSAQQVDITHNNNSEGGDFALEEKNALMAEFNISPESIDFDLSEFTVDELREKFEAMREPVEPNTCDPVEEPVALYALADQVRETIIEMLSVEKITTEWGCYPRYYFVDFDYEAMELYCYDETDWHLYGMTYAMDGDAVVIDFDSKKRKKFSIVDFEGGESIDENSILAPVFESMTEKYNAVKNELLEANDKISVVNNELESLRQFKAIATDELNRYHEADARDKFADLVGIEEFECLCKKIGEYERDDFEEKCFAIRGKNTTPQKFSHEPASTRLPVMGRDGAGEDEPYGNLFIKFSK